MKKLLLFALLFTAKANAQCFQPQPVINLRVEYDAVSVGVNYDVTDSCTEFFVFPVFIKGNQTYNVTSLGWYSSHYTKKADMFSIYQMKAAADLLGANHVYKYKFAVTSINCNYQSITVYSPRTILP